MSDDDPGTARRLIGGPDLAWLRLRVTRRLARGRVLHGVTTLSDPSEAQVAAAARLFGRPFRMVRALRVDLGDTDAILRRAGVPGGLAEAVESLEGSVVDQAAQRRRLDQQWEEVTATLQDVVAGEGEWAIDWLEQIQATGLLKRVAGDPASGGALVAQLADVLGAVPAPQVFRSRFAAEVVGDAHALDRGPLATVVRSALKARYGRPMLPGAEGRIETWASAGILVGDLTSTVLVAGFATRPQVWTLRQVARLEVSLQPAMDRAVFVVENPTVLAEAVELLGESCPPMICASGQPTVAVLALLRQLSDVAMVLRYHGDFDWDGIRVANGLVQRVGVKPWRLGTGDYLTAVADGLGGVALKAGREAAAVWDPDLADAMREAGLAVEEESLLKVLLDDLAVAAER